MRSNWILAAVMAFGGALAAGAAQARTDVQWSVTIGAPVYVRPAPVYYAPPPVYYVPPPVYYTPAPVYYAPRHVHYRAPVYRDRDRDSIPDRYDARYDPYGDRDRDGVPNRYDRYDRNPWRR